MRKPRRDSSVQAGWVWYLGDALTGHFEAADFVGWAVAVLERAHETQGGLAVAFEVADYVD